MKGDSPYLRHTYRYTPLLAYMAISNELLFSWTCKVIFCITDVLVGLLIYCLLDIGCEKKKVILTSLWIFNPLILTIPSRGSADSLVCFLTLSTIYYLQKGNTLRAALFYGLAVHFKIYPVIYGLFIFRILYK